MTAFAAVVWPCGATSRPDVCVHVSDALHDVAGRRPTTLEVDGCTLWLAVPQPFGIPRSVAAAGPIAAVGQVLLEDPGSIASRLSATGTLDDLDLAARAVERWGDGCGEQINGEYALAAFDTRRQTLRAMRDGLGVRLLYTAVGRTGLIVTNVLAAARHEGFGGCSLDERSLLEFLVEGGPADAVRTPYRSIRLVPPGHTLIAGHTEPVRIERHWRFPTPSMLRARPPDVCEGYRAVLRRAVADRTRDHRCAIFLSGGVDSGTIAAAASLERVALTAFTATYDRLAPGDEVEFARTTADRLRLPLVTFAGDRHGALAPSGPPPADLVDEPTLADWRAAARLVSQKGPVALYGEDGDALFLPPGYAALRSGMSFATFVRSAAWLALSRGSVPYLGVRLRERLHGRSATPPPMRPSWLTGEAPVFTPDPATASTVLGVRIGAAPIHPTRPDVQARFGLPVSRSLATLIAAETTRAQLEIRLPLLDTRVLSYVVSVPPIPWCQNKRLPRDAFRGVLPDRVLNRPKRGVAGFNEALVREWRRTRARGACDLVNDTLSWVARDVFERTLQHGGWRDVMVAWRVLQLDGWLRHVRAPSPEPARV